MPRIITVKGVGKLSAKPDWVIISMSLESTDKEYVKAMEIAAEELAHINASLTTIGFEKESVKTTKFNVHTEYDRLKDKNDNYYRVFNGFVCSHSLKLEFDFDSKKLAQTLSAVAKCLANPKISVAFTVKDPTAVNETLLREATTNAKNKAKLLCDASGVKLGQILTIDYNWGELNIYSNTRYSLSEECLEPMTDGGSIDIQPDDIDVEDTATFVWEIL